LGFTFWLCRGILFAVEDTMLNGTIKKFLSALECHFGKNKTHLGGSIDIGRIYNIIDTPNIRTREYPFN